MNWVQIGVNQIGFYLIIISKLIVRKDFNLWYFLIIFIFKKVINLFCYISLCLLILVSIAFLTLIERKLLGFSGIRLGPNYISLIGVFQPFTDIIKLLFKKFILIRFSDYFFWLISPIWGLILLLISFLFLDIYIYIIFNEIRIIIIFVIYSLIIYFFIFTRWSSNNKFRIISRTRSLVQVISYEVGFIFIVILIFMIEFSTNLNFLIMNEFNFITINLIFIIIWIIISLSELNRSPFDFLEGESELVSGFNLEFRRIGFILIFLVEYGFLFFLSYLSSLILWSNIIMIFFFLILFITLRGRFPRIRFDLMILLYWKDLLILIITFFFIINIIL